MALNKDVFRALEDIVGTENISEDQFILDSYARRSGMAGGPEMFVPRFDAIVLPDNTPEVQSIVKLCNRAKIQYKASSTGWGFFSDPSGPGCIQLDLRRMNRIIEINEKNMYAVVEPYVIGAQLEAELMKKHLICNMTGAGANCSALSIAAHSGGGHMCQTTSTGERNQLALEWVAPDGEIIRLGSLGSTGDWFCGDGPGPSLRGIARGTKTALGGMGVFTKSAAKIYHWPGPAIFPVEGVSPKYVTSYFPDGFLARYIHFPDYETMYKAERKVGESEIAFELMAFDITMVAANAAIDNQDELNLLAKFREEIQGPGFFVILASDSPEELQYKQKVLELITEEFNGKSLKDVEDPRFGGSMMWRCIRITGSIRETMRATGIFGGAQGTNESFQGLFEFIRKVSAIKFDLGKKGLVLDDKGDAMGWALENGHMGHGELLLRWGPYKDSSIAAGQLVEKSSDIAIEGHYGVPFGASGDECHDMYGPYASYYNVWMRKVKMAFDPNEASESSTFISSAGTTEIPR